MNKDCIKKQIMLARDATRLYMNQRVRDVNGSIRTKKDKSVVDYRNMVAADLRYFINKLKD